MACPVIERKTSDRTGKARQAALGRAGHRSEWPGRAGVDRPVRDWRWQARQGRHGNARRVSERHSPVRQERKGDLWPVGLRSGWAGLDWRSVASSVGDGHGAERPELIGEARHVTRKSGADWQGRRRVERLVASQNGSARPGRQRTAKRGVALIGWARQDGLRLDWRGVASHSKAGEARPVAVEMGKAGRNKAGEVRLGLFWLGVLRDGSDGSGEAGGAVSGW